MGVVVVQKTARIHAKRPGPGQAVGRQHGTGNFFDAVNAVGVAGQRVHTLQVAQRHGQSQQKFHIAATPTSSLESHRGFTTAEQHTGCLERLSVVHYLARHAAQHFGYRFDPERIHANLQQLRGDAGAQAWRVRLLIDAQGQVWCEKFALPSTPEPIALALATRCLEAAHSEFTRFKTTQRAHYDAFAPTDPTVFDTLLYNAQDQLTECTRGNIALLLDGRWVTPPLRCGLLGGIGRAHWLQQGRLSEAVVTRQDLPRVQALAFINSLRGWLDARLIS